MEWMLTHRGSKFSNKTLGYGSHFWHNSNIVYCNCKSVRKQVTWWRLAFHMSLHFWASLSLSSVLFLLHRSRPAKTRMVVIMTKRMFSGTECLFSLATLRKDPPLHYPSCRKPISVTNVGGASHKPQSLKCHQCIHTGERPYPSAVQEMFQGARNK